MDWVSPTGHSDPNNKWGDEANAYDEDLESPVFSFAYIGDRWLELTHAGLECSKVRFYYIRHWETGAAIDCDIEVYYGGDWHNIHSGVAGGSEAWEEFAIGSTQTVTACRIRNNMVGGSFYFNEMDFWGVVAPTVTTQAATSVEATTATGNGNITDNGGEDCDIRGIVWDLASHGDPGNVAPGASGYANDVPQTDSFGTGAFTRSLTGLPTGDTIYARAYAHNSAGYAYGAEVNFLTKPAAPTSVAATDGEHTDKVVITWTKSTGATGYKVYEGANLLDTLGDVATYDDNAAPAPTITPGAAAASDGVSPVHVVLSLAGESANVGASRTYKVVAFNATGDSADSDTDAGYRGIGALTYQWQRSAADSDAAYGNIAGATTDPYNDTGAPGNGQGRWYLCLLDATGAAQAESTHDRGYRWMGEKTAHMAAKMIAGKLI